MPSPLIFDECDGSCGACHLIAETLDALCDERLGCVAVAPFRAGLESKDAVYVTTWPLTWRHQWESLKTGGGRV